MNLIFLSCSCQNSQDFSDSLRLYCQWIGGECTKRSSVCFHVKTICLALSLESRHIFLEEVQSFNTGSKDPSHLWFFFFCQLCIGIFTNGRFFFNYISISNVCFKKTLVIAHSQLCLYLNANWRLSRVLINPPISLHYPFTYTLVKN